MCDQCAGHDACIRLIHADFEQDLRADQEQNVDT